VNYHVHEFVYFKDDSELLLNLGQIVSIHSSNKPFKVTVQEVIRSGVSKKTGFLDDVSDSSITRKQNKNNNINLLYSAY
jgi:hypothetical protein